MARFSASADLALNTHCLFSVKLTTKPASNDKAGEKGSIDWVLPNIFNDGKYFVTTAISHEDGTTQHDWTEDIATFKVYREDRTAFIVNPYTELKLERSTK